MNADKTRAIVLKAIRYGDNNLIVKLLTEQNGLQSFMVKGAFNKTAKIRAALFQPLTLLDIVCAKSRGELGYLREASIEYAYQDTPINISKNAIVLFLCELLTKSIQEAETDLDMFGFIHQSLVHLDSTDGNCADFPLAFAVKLSDFLGFSPNIKTYRQGFVFDLEEGCFRHDGTNAIYVIDKQQSELLHKLCVNNILDDFRLNISNQERRQMLETVITYYKLHVSGFNEMKSTDVLKTVLQSEGAAR
ncbi:MAG: DNA repair protein RecO [Bacteroidales bacterium]|nr:DNA repair protein RecO [Bacteroidales bacterium]